MRIRFDAAAVRLGATPIEVRPGGFKVYRGVATYGDVVLEYPEDGWNEFVPASTALDPETVRLTEGVPFTVVHPDDLLDASDEESIREHTEGFVLRAMARPDADPPEMVVDVVVHTASAQQAIESGLMRDLSLGYERKAEDRAGTHGGKAYQKVQTGRRPNHLSGVRTARSTTPDGRRARLDAAVVAGAHEVRMDDVPADARIDHRLSIQYAADGRVWAEVDGGGSMSVAPPPDAWLDSLALARRLLVHGDSLGALPRVDSPRRRAAYAHPGDHMPDDQNPNLADPTRVDADPEFVVADPAAADPMAAALAMFSPEAVEILKTLPEADMMVLQDLAVTKRGEAAEEAVVAAAGGVPPVEVEEAEEMEDATVPAAAQALTMDAVQRMIADALAKAGMAPKADAAGVVGDTIVVQRSTRSSAARIDAADVARRAADLADSDRQFVERVRSAGHRCDSVRDATVQALAVIRSQSPGLVASAERALKDGRRDDFAAMFDAAEDSRRADLLGDQFAVLGAAQQQIAADRLGTPAAFPSNFTAPARAVTGD